MSATDTQEAAALARLTADELGKATGGIQNLHAAIARRAFGNAPASSPARVLHDCVARAVYGAVQGGSRAAGWAAGQALSRGELQRVSESRKGASLLAVINGLRGDALHDDGDVLAIRMAVRVDGRPVEPEVRALREAFPQATGRIAVFVHGLFGTEHEWGLGGREPYGTRLAREHGWTPVYVRYNTGRAIEENGAELDRLLDALYEAWPVPVRSFALIGHSMGGLVSRSACHRASDRGWKRKLKHTITLGTPHAGSPVAQGVHHLASALGKLPETSVFGAFFERRSQGIRDLQRGLAHPPVETARHHYVAAGSDVLVLGASAVPKDAEHVLRVPGIGHLALLNHDEVYEQIRAWLEA